MKTTGYLAGPGPLVDSSPAPMVKAQGLTAGSHAHCPQGENALSQSEMVGGSKQLSSAKVQFLYAFGQSFVLE
jgi:hypothetical protein